MSDASEFDYGEEHTPKPKAQIILELQEMVDDAGRLKGEVAELSEQLMNKQSALSDLIEDQIPNKLKMCGLKSLETEQGYKVEIETDLFASIPSVTAINKERDPVKRQYMVNRRVQAFKWLEDNKHDKIIKREITVEFDKGSKDDADALMEQLKNSDKPMHVTESMDVHPQTIRALLKKLREQSKVFPADVFGVYDKAVAKVSKS